VTNAAMPGNATPLYGGFLPADYWAGAKGQPVKADYAKAKQLLTEAGYPNGFKMVISTFAAFDYEVRASQAIQQQLKGAGIEVEIKAAESGVVFSSVIAGNYEANVFAFSATFDPDDRVSQSFTTTGSTNWFGYSDPEVDRLAAQGRQILAEDKRAEVYRQLQTRITESGPMAFLFTYYLYDVAQKYVQGYTWFGQFYYRSLRDVWLNK
jgi:peptide/nickel transport system substrate-binding protein